MLKLTVLVPCHNEEGIIAETVQDLYNALSSAQIPHEILVVNDHSADKTADILKNLQSSVATLRVTNNQGAGGFGLAIRWGLNLAEGDCVAIYMADASDLPADLIRFYRLMEAENIDAVFGTRFHRDASVTGYPIFKLLLNRCANKGIQLLFGLKYNDMTNAFKLYHRRTLNTMSPLLSHHFNLTVEMPLKTIIRGHSYRVIPNCWRGRTKGYSKLRIKEMGSRYLFIIFYCFLEKWLSRGDYLAPREQEALFSESP